MATLLTLAKRLDFTTETEYYDYCIDSHGNGQFDQCKNLFGDLSRAQKKDLLMYIKQNSALHLASDVYQFYFNLL